MMPRPALSPRACAVLEALAEVLLPDGGPIALQREAVDIQGFALRFAADAPPTVRWVMVGTLHALDRLGWLWAGAGPRGFARLSAAQRARVIDGWRRSRWPALRSALQVVSLPVLLPYYQDPRVLQALGVVANTPNASHPPPREDGP